MLAVAGAGAWLVETPLLPVSVNGAGDAVAALFLGHWLRSGGDPAAALAGAVASIFAVLQATHDSGARELQLVAAQDELVAPRRFFPVRRVR
jgi:pyridoxine kinase